MKTIETSLGFPLLQTEKDWEIHLEELRLFTGLSVLAKILADQILDYMETQIGDVSFLYKINPNINPELLEMQIVAIQVYARSGVLDDVLFNKDEFHYQFRTIFGTFQRPKWAKRLHPEFYGEDPRAVESCALIFPFLLSTGNKKDFRFILERVANTRYTGKFFLRLTIENEDRITPILSNGSMIVDDLDLRVYIAGTTKLSESISDKILTASSKGLLSYSEDNAPYSTLFEQLHKTHLEKVDQINFYWNRNFSEMVQDLTKEDQVTLFKKIFLSLEDEAVCRLLQDGETIRLELGIIFVNLYLTRLSRVLNFSLGQDKKSFTLDYYLKRMPALEKIGNSVGHNLDYANTRIFLIHHITSEIIALIEAFRRLKVDGLDVMFVKYAGVIPSAYLDVLLDVTDKNFFMAGLMRHLTENNKEYFTPAKYYTDISDHTHLHSYLTEKRLGFLEAMKYLSCYFFLLFISKAIQDGKKVLVIEDGGYLAPLLNEYALTEKTTEEVYAIYGITKNIPNGKSFKDLLQTNLVGSVEHTRNGYDRLAAVIKNHGNMINVAYSIAISKNKVVEESKEVAHSILSAIESILHGQGMILSSKKTIILGAMGNIGSFLSKYLQEGRLHDTNKELIKVDIRYEKITNDTYRALSEISDEIFLSLELFIGVIGASILKREFLEKLILKGNKSRLIFASGSTKTVEFSELSDFFYEVHTMDSPQIAGVPVRIFYDKIIDPQTNSIQGTKVILNFKLDGAEVEKTLYLLGDLSPINFLFYGVPTETMDLIIAQLTTVSLGLLDQYKSGSLPSPGLYAVDHQIDGWGNKL
ncbi:MAG: hypothetical protein KBA66_03660 [Leptospiraceae bacterium]|nr:hypothetical protein [Leptospiraceae bacterium]